MIGRTPELRFARMAKKDDAGTRSSPHGASSADPSDPPDVKKTDFAEMPLSSKSFEALRGAKSSAEYERAKRPYAPLPKGESAPTMAQLWAYANRRYGRFQGYAWGGVVAVAFVAWGASQIAGKPPEKKRATMRK